LHRCASCDGTVRANSVLGGSDSAACRQVQLNSFC
jgi:hypothetical protein